VLAHGGPLRAILAHHLGLAPGHGEAIERPVLDEGWLRPQLQKDLVAPRP